MPDVVTDTHGLIWYLGYSPRLVRQLGGLLMLVTAGWYPDDEE